MGVKRIPGAGFNYGKLRELFRHTLESNFVPFQTIHRLSEKTFAIGRHARYVVLIPVYRRVHSLEDILDRLCDLLTNTISRNERNLRRS